ncbi:MAG TPA: hypothetical protein VH593_18155 [Ktedonobacteraceae bacterium]
MPKKSSSGRSGSQRQRTRAQKGVELVRPTSEENTSEAVEEKQQVKESVATATATPETPKTETSKAESKSNRASTAISEPAEAPKSEPKTAAPETVPPKAGSASARIAAKRHTTLRVQRNVSLISPEHFAYVRRDLIFIGILAIIMIGAIITLYFMLGK